MPPWALRCTEEWRDYANEYCRDCNRGWGPSYCKRICDYMQKRLKEECGKKPKPPVATTACERMAKHWDKRFRPGGGLDPYWGTDCAACCEHVFADCPFTDVYTQCVSGCMQGEFGGGRALPPGTGFGAFR
jgi:hypothetical protein